MRMREPKNCESLNLGEMTSMLETVRLSLYENIESCGHFIASALRKSASSESLPDKERNAIRNLAEEWINKVETDIENTKGKQIQDYLEWYDIIHRLLFYAPPKFSFIYKYMHQAWKDLIKGEDTDKLRLINWIRNAVFSHSQEIDDGMIQWSRLNIQKWVDRFLNPNSVGMDLLADDDSIRIINILLQENLNFLGDRQKVFKIALIKKVLPYLDIINNNSVENINLSRLQLEALGLFASIAIREFPEIDYDEVRSKILRKLKSDNRLDIISRKAYAIDLEYETSLAF